MLKTEPSPALNAEPTDIKTESPCTRDDETAYEARERWQELIDYRLIEWFRDPSRLEDDEIPPPSSATIRLAIELADRCRRKGFAAPTRVVPDAHAGIVFERDAGDVFESIRISADGTTEYCAFVRSRLVERELWTLPTVESE